MYYFTRKLDSDDEDLVFQLRCGYGTVQAFVLSMVIYLYFQASAFSKTSDGKKVVFITKPAQPFTDQNAKKQYTEVSFGKHIESLVRSFIGSWLFQILVQIGLHWYKGMISTFAMQLIMAPLSVLENDAAKFLIFGSKDAFEIKSREQLTADDEIVDDSGNPVVPTKKSDDKAKVVKKENAENKGKKTFETILLDTWDEGAEADIKPLMAAITKKNVNYKASESGWTPLMIMAGLGGDGVTALKKMKTLGADPNIVDGEGWNALHWSAFHGYPDAAEYILSPIGFDGVSIGLHTMKDKEGKTPLVHAKAEANLEAYNIIEKLTSSDKTNKKK